MVWIIWCTNTSLNSNSSPSTSYSFPLSRSSVSDPSKTPYAWPRAFYSPIHTHTHTPKKPYINLPVAKSLFLRKCLCAWCLLYQMLLFMTISISLKDGKFSQSSSSTYRTQFELKKAWRPQCSLPVRILGTLQLWNEIPIFWIMQSLLDIIELVVVKSYLKVLFP